MKIYIDSDYKRHAANDGTMRTVEMDFLTVGGTMAEVEDEYAQ